MKRRKKNCTHIHIREKAPEQNDETTTFYLCYGAYFYFSLNFLLFGYRFFLYIYFFSFRIIVQFSVYHIMGIGIGFFATFNFSALEMELYFGIRLLFVIFFCLFFFSFLLSAFHLRLLWPREEKKERKKTSQKATNI